MQLGHKAGIVYFLTVFGAGFALALVRIPVLVPRFGVRTAELLEMPVMLAVIAWASHRLFLRYPKLGRAARLQAGTLALALLVCAELLLAFFLSGQTPAEHVASRDPVSGSAYLLALLCFALAPALWGGPRPPSGRDKHAPPDIKRPG